jgi:hypothetical protein
MNLGKNAVEAELASLIARCDDEAASHILWVEFGGRVHLDAIPSNLTSLGFARLHQAKLKFRQESFAQGNGYTGRAASKDAAWVRRLFSDLTALWEQGFEGHSSF